MASSGMVSVHSTLEVTVSSSTPPSSEAFRASGETVSTGFLPSWATDTVLFTSPAATVTVPSRVSRALFSGTVIFTDPLPSPLSVPMVIQSASLVTVQWSLQVMATVCSPPATSKFTVRGETVSSTTSCLVQEKTSAKAARAVIERVISFFIIIVIGLKNYMSIPFRPATGSANSGPAAGATGGNRPSVPFPRGFSARAPGGNCPPVRPGYAVRYAHP